MMASQIPGVSDEQYLGLFMGGLKEEIRMELQILEPITRYKAILMATNVERKLIRARIFKAPVLSRRNHKFQGNYPREIFHYNNRKGLDNLMSKFILITNLVRRTNKAGEAKKGQ